MNALNRGTPIKVIIWSVLHNKWKTVQDKMSVLHTNRKSHTSTKSSDLEWPWTSPWPWLWKLGQKYHSEVQFLPVSYIFGRLIGSWKNPGGRVKSNVSHLVAMATHFPHSSTALTRLSGFFMNPGMSPLQKFIVEIVPPNGTCHSLCLRYAWSSVWSISQHCNVCMITENSPVHYLPAHLAH